MNGPIPPARPEAGVAEYAFGDSPVAAERLSLLAQTYAASSRSFLRASVDFRPELAADLGCGPGHSTHLLANALKPAHTIGFDNSKSFLAQALATSTKSVGFELHDITVAPFPRGPFDLMYGRFVLTHLRDPKSVIETWVSQLCPGGILLIEEVEFIDSRIDEFVLYLGIQQSMLASQANALYVGPLLGMMTGFENARLISSNVTRLDVAAPRAASMFHMNLASIREREFVRDNYDASRIDELYRGLLAIADCKSQVSAHPAVKWGLRQISLERAP
ncbi:MAG: class I SAM-dependent methyltransferase [Chloroflexota bacterium]|nr:class I SAM-dependent methyltransferase [Chloroflexota bacterium]